MSAERLIVAAVVSRPGSVLLLRRAVDPFLGDPCHELPSGVVEPGEALPDAVVRVVRAVTGLAVAAVGELLGRFEYRAVDGTQVRHFVFAVDVVAAEPVRLTRHIGHRWAPLTDDLDVPDAVRAIVQGRR